MLVPWSRCTRSKSRLDQYMESDLEGRSSAPEDNNDWRLCVRDQSETFPNHKARCEDRGKVEDLKQDL